MADRTFLLLLLAACSGSGTGGGSATSDRPDSPPPIIRDSADLATHRVASVAVPGGWIEYLDWGGTGSPVILLAGLGSTGHVFDDFAPLLSRQFRVVAITRRGFGASFRPDSSYDTPRLGTDVVAVLDELGIERAAVVGHSLGGAEAIWLAVHRPTRIERIVLLESYCTGCPAPPPDSSLVESRPAGAPPHLPRATAGDRASVEAWLEYVERVTGARPPAAEIRATFEIDGNGRLGARREAGVARGSVRRESVSPEYRRLRVPALLVLAGPDSAAVETASGPEQPRDGPWADWGDRLRGAATAAWAAAFAEGVANGEVQSIPGASHHIYLSHPRPVAELIAGFLSR